MVAVYVNYLDGDGFMCHYSQNNDTNLIKECNEILFQSQHYLLLGQMFGTAELNMTFKY